MSTDVGTEETFNENTEHDAPPGSTSGVDGPMNHPEGVGDDLQVDSDSYEAGGDISSGESTLGGDAVGSAPPTLDDTSDDNGSRWEDESPASGGLGSDDRPGEYANMDRDDDDRDRENGSSFKDKVQEFSDGVKSKFS